jgi:hypothetical protein
MSNQPRFTSEGVPSGKHIERQFAEDGSLLREQHSYGALDIGITRVFQSGKKTSETYFVKRRMVSRRAYEKARPIYPDMPPADTSLEDLSGRLVNEAAKERRRNRQDDQRRLAASEESRFPRPSATNWLRVVTADKAHLLIFASRDWKFLTDEKVHLPTGQIWMQLFGLVASTDVGRGLEVGIEVTSNRLAMVEASRTLMSELNAWLDVPPAAKPWVNTRSNVRKQIARGWLAGMAPLIEFLETLDVSTVKVFNHHR